MKNKVIFSIMVSLVLISCGGGGNEPAPAPEPKNTAPTVPLLITPVANKLCISNIVSFEWGVSIDAEKNSIVYQLQIATDNQFAQIVSTSDISNLTQTVTLEKGKAYYWRVKAIDSKNASSAYSSTNSFYTEGVAVSNHIPFIPQILSPSNNSTISSTSTTLKWSGSDVDVNDVLSYDVYLGTEANPTTKIVDNKTVTSYDATLQATKIYYWKVIVRDNKGGETSGQIWSFRTN